MPQIRLVCDDKEKVARLFINTVSPEWLPLEAEIILRSPEDELNCPLVKNLSEQDQEILQWFWYDMGFGPHIENG